MNFLERYNISVLEALNKLPDSTWSQFYTRERIRWSNPQIQLVCPFHNDNTPSLWMNTEMMAYNCFVCSQRGKENSKVLKDSQSIWHWNIIQFFRLYFEQKLNYIISNEELAILFWVDEKLKNKFISELSRFDKWEVIEGLTPSTLQVLENKKNQEEILYPYTYLKKYKDNNDTYLRERLFCQNDITEEQFLKTKEHFLLGTTKTGDIVIPITQNWNLYWTYVRSATQDKKWKYYMLEAFKKSDKLFHIDFVSKYDTIILVEWPLNAIRLWSLWYKNVVSWFWAVFLYHQIKKLKNKRIILWFDNDYSWQEWEKILREKKINIVWKIQTEWKYDAFDFNKQQIDYLIKTCGSTI